MHPFLHQHGTTEFTADEKGARAGWPLCPVLDIRSMDQQSLSQL